MALYTLENVSLRLLVSEQGGAIEGFWVRRGGQERPVLRPGRQSGVAVDSSCFPLVPFGNRISGNAFSLNGRTYRFQPNVSWDRHYLHGDGWLARWRCIASSSAELALAFVHREGVYRYTARQTFQLTEDALAVTLTVVSEGEEALPFGLGWHPYFPLSPQTRLSAQAQGYWLEKENWLAGDYQDSLPSSLDFNHFAPLPETWVNNGFAGWDGRAVIRQPGLGYRVLLETDPPAPCYFIFVSDPAFDEGYAFDFFCMEPMSHAPDDHHRPGFGHLSLLAPGETLQQRMRLQLQDDASGGGS